MLRRLSISSEKGYSAGLIHAQVGSHSERSEAGLHLLRSINRVQPDGAQLGYAGGQF